MQKIDDVHRFLDLEEQGAPTGYVVRHWKGLDVIAYAHPKGNHVAIKTPGPVHRRCLTDKKYSAEIVYTPLELPRWGLIRVNGNRFRPEKRSRLPWNVEHMILKDERLKDTIEECINSIWCVLQRDPHRVVQWERNFLYPDTPDPDMRY